jgi:hypothetical protein
MNRCNRCLLNDDKHEHGTYGNTASSAPGHASQGVGAMSSLAAAST